MRNQANTPCSKQQVLKSGHLLPSPSVRLLEDPMRLTPLAVLSAAVLLGPLPARGQEVPGAPAPPAAAPAAEDPAVHDLYAWFDGLHLWNLEGRPLVSFTIGAWSRTTPPEATVFQGFLLSEDGDDFRILFLDGRTYDLHRSPGREPSAAGADRVGWSPLDLETHAREVLTYPGEGGRERPPVFAPDDTVRLFLLSRACRERGLTDLGRRLLLATGMTRNMEIAEGCRRVRHYLEKRLSFSYLDWIESSRTAGRETRANLLPLLRRIPEAFPGTRAAEAAARTAAVLERMTAEEKDHTPPKGFPDACPREAAAREWIWRLRDLTSDQWSYEEAANPYRPPEPGDPSPAHRLAALGVDAVPALLEVWDDDRVTRCRETMRHFSTLTQTFGDIAQQVVLRIAGQWFTNRDAAEAWWKRVRERGYEAVLAEGVTGGGPESVAQARILLQSFPRSAVEVLARGIAAAGNEGVREQLVEILGGVEGDGPLPALIWEAASGPSIAARVAAAEALLRRGRLESVEGLVEAWKRVKGQYGTDRLILFLAACGRLDALRALGEPLDRIPPPFRIEVLEAIHRAADGSGAGPPPGGEWREEAQRILAGRLLDREIWMGTLRGIGDLSYRDPRVCDVAAAILGRLRGTPDAVDFAASPSARDRACLRLANAWRREQGLAALPEPARLPAAHAPWAIREAAAGPGSVELPPTVKGLLDRLRGKDLHPEEVVGLLVQSLKTLPESAEGLDLFLERPEDGSGAALLLTLLPVGTVWRPSMEGWPERSDRGGWEHTEMVVRSGQSLRGAFGSSTEEYLEAPAGWEDLAAAMADALKAGPGEPVEVRVRVMRD